MTVIERREIHTEFWWGNLKEKDNFEHLVIELSIILKWIRKIGWGRVDRIDVSEYRM